MINELKEQIRKLKKRYSDKWLEAYTHYDVEAQHKLLAKISACDEFLTLIDDVIETEITNIVAEEARRWLKSTGTTKN